MTVPESEVYAIFGRASSEIMLILNGPMRRFACILCSLTDPDEDQSTAWFHRRSELITHLISHRSHGDYVPEVVMARVEHELDTLGDYITTHSKESS